MSDTSAHSAAAITRLTERVTSILEPLTKEFTELEVASKEVDSYEGCGPRLSTVMGSLVQPVSPPIEDEAVITDHQRVCNTTQSVEQILYTSMAAMPRPDILWTGTQTTHNGGGMRPPLSWKPGEPIGWVRKTTTNEARKAASLPRDYEPWV